MVLVNPKCLKFILDEDFHTVKTADYFKRNQSLDISRDIPSFIGEDSQQIVDEKMKPLLFHLFQGWWPTLNARFSDFYLEYTVVEIKNNSFRQQDISNRSIRLSI